MEDVEHAVLETLASVTEAVEAFLHDTRDRGSLNASFGRLRQLRGALSILAFERGARLLREAEHMMGAYPSRGDEAVADAKVLLQALRALEAYLAPVDGEACAGADLEAVTAALYARRSDAAAHEPAPVIVFPAHATDADDAVGQAVDWERGCDEACGDRVPSPLFEAGTSIAEIKGQLKAVVQVMPLWCENLRDDRHLQALHHSFLVIADRARALKLVEIDKLATLLERLVARVDDDMISVTMQMMYGVIEQGVLKLGILFLQHCRPQGSARGSLAGGRLEDAVADLQSLTHQVSLALYDGGHLQALPGVAGAGRAAAQGDDLQDVRRDERAAGRGAIDYRRLEDLLVEANLLHSQLLPRIQMMRRQQREIQRQLACLQSGGIPEAVAEGESERPGDEVRGLSGKVAAMSGASQLLAGLIGECEDSLQRFRRASREVQDTLLGEVSRAFPV